MRGVPLGGFFFFCNFIVFQSFASLQHTKDPKDITKLIREAPGTPGPIPPQFAAIFSSEEFAEVSKKFDKNLDFGGGKIEKVPEGYWKGLALSYIQSSCRNHDSDPVYKKLTEAAVSGSKDALSNTYLLEKLSKVGLSDFTTSSPKNMLAIYAIEFALGIHESGGGHDTGVEKEGDLSVCQTHTAGTWQTSMNSENGMDKNVLAKLNQDYSSNDAPVCKTAVFRQGVTPKLEYSAEASCQAFERKQTECPGYAAEYNAAFLRKESEHHGPIKNKVLSIPQEAVDLFKAADNYISKKGCPNFGTTT